jgi:DNA-directed RNA polymerase
MRVLVIRQLCREAASSLKLTEAHMRRDSIENGIADFTKALSTARKLKGLPAPVQFDGKGSNPANTLEVSDLVAATWSGMSAAFGKMMRLDGCPVQTAAKRIGSALRSATGGIAPHKRLGYEQAALVLIDYFCHATGWVQEVTGERRFGSVTRETNNLVATDKFYKEVLVDSSLCEFLEGKPMLVPPVPWTPEACNGGYLYAGVQAVRGVRRAVGSREITDALNALQGTAWRTNARVLEVANAVEREGVEWNGYRLEERHDNPNYRSELIRAAMTLDAFEELKDEDAYWFPWNLCWRGRMYPATTIISPQGSDLCKGLLEFADGTPLGRDGAKWLAIHLCNLYGADKFKENGRKVNRTAEEREAWTWENEDLILSVARDPLANRAWQEADKPYQFLAACLEWDGLAQEGYAFRSRLAGALDGSCSGVQMLSGMTRDASAGAMVNLTPTERGDDYYGRMAEALTRRLCGLVAGASAETMEHLRFWSSHAIDRDLLKSPSMTKVYSAGTYTFGEQVQAKTGASDAECIWLAARINECFGDVAPGMLGAMAYLQGVADVLTEANLPLVWSTPVGLKVEQSRYNEESIRLRTRTHDVLRDRLFYVNRDTLSKKGQRAGVSPNFVHGVDASHMVRVVNDLYRRGVRNFWMVHDSFGAPFAQCQDVFESTREQFVELMQEDLLGAWTQQVTAALAPEQREKLLPLPEYGTLDLNAVRESGYAWF